MSEAAPPRITGYRHLSDTELALVNEAKALGEDLRSFIAKMKALNIQHAGALVDLLWLDVATTDMQKAFMALVRSITKPTTF